MFFQVFHVLHLILLIFNDYYFSRHIAVPTVCISHFPSFWVFPAIFQVKECLCIIFHLFQFFFVIFNVLQCPFLIFTFFIVPNFTSYSMYFSFSFWVFLAIFQVLQCVFLIFHVFWFLAIIRSYIVHFSFSTFFSFSRHISHPTVCISHSPWFSVFLPYSRSYSVFL